MSAFDKLVALNVNEHTETKTAGGTQLTYLSWAWAWAETKKRFPDASYEIFKDANGLPYVCDPATGYMVYTSVTIDGITHQMWLPVMDGNNKAMKTEPYTIKTKYKEITVAAATMFDINKTIMRCLVKNLAMFGLGLYIYAGEDLPEPDESDEPVQAEKAAPKKVPAKKETAKKPAENAVHKCARCGDALQPITGKDGQPITPDALAQMSAKRFGAVYCPECQRAALAAKKAKAAG